MSWRNTRSSAPRLAPGALDRLLNGAFQIIGPYSTRFRRPGKGRVEVLTEEGSLRRLRGGQGSGEVRSHQSEQLNPSLER